MNSQSILKTCQWRGAHGAEDAARILTFLDQVGIPVIAHPVPGGLLPGMTVSQGAIHIDPDIPAWPGDLLHEAGHIAMTDPELRDSMAAVSDNPGEEMGAIAWSVAAALEIGVALEAVFHGDGYRGASESHAENFAAGRTFGVPMLALYGMSAEPHRAAEQGREPFPAMTRWLR